MLERIIDYLLECIFMAMILGISILGTLTAGL
jgi:hypothetical protein